MEQHSQPLSKAEQDMTKLCNHRRKVVAMAALCRSMQSSQLPFANLHYPGNIFADLANLMSVTLSLLTLKTFCDSKYTIFHISLINIFLSRVKQRS